ncbi:MAG TPA: hypothetical protein VNU48_12445 [Burkholderiaceae bacterium]|nr:hypothetical protein [Burkholderiaceae bacterium]
MSQGGSSIDVLSVLRGLLPATAADGVDLNLALPWPGPPPAGPAPADASGWERSSLELLTGVEVTDFSETISGEVFFELFRR